MPSLAPFDHLTARFRAEQNLLQGVQRGAWVFWSFDQLLSEA